MTEAEAEAHNNDDENSGDRASALQAELSGNIKELKSTVDVQVAEFEKVRIHLILENLVEYLVDGIILY